MTDADDSETNTPGTDQEEIDEDARLVGNEPDEEAIDEPTRGGEQEAEETYWILKETLAIGLVSIFGGLLLALGLMQATGLVSLPGPLEGSAIANGAVFVALGALLVGAFAWSQWRT